MSTRFSFRTILISSSENNNVFDDITTAIMSVRKSKITGWTLKLCLDTLKTVMVHLRHFTIDGASILWPVSLQVLTCHWISVKRCLAEQAPTCSANLPWRNKSKTNLQMQLCDKKNKSIQYLINQQKRSQISIKMAKNYALLIYSMWKIPYQLHSAHKCLPYHSFKVITF